MSKQVVYAITIVLCILLQAGISPAIAIMGCSPNFLLIPVLLISMRSGTGMGSIAGFLLGLLYDLMGSGTIGCMALVFTLIAMWRFLRRSFDTMVGSILRCLGMMFAAYGIDVLLSLVLQLGTSLIGELPVPNNDAVTGLARTDYKRMIAVAVLMAPLVEECLFRGVVFGTIRPKSRFWAYAASIALFSLYHVWQYVLVYQDPKLLLSALAYVPVSAALTFCYEQTRSIWPPVFFHMCINALSLTVLTG